MKKSKLFIGTSGWAYDDWRDSFYPKLLPTSQRLSYYSSHFCTTEINSSFYHLPRETTYKNWRKQVPKRFVFSLKVSRYITHIKRLKNIKKDWEIFIERAKNLKEKLGPFLLQFPSSFKLTSLNKKRLANFLKFAAKSKHMLAVEFRHKSWACENVYELLKKYKTAWVISDSSHWKRFDMVTANFVYIRMHGPTSLFSSLYSSSEIKELAKLIKSYLKKHKKVFVYFNNDFHGYAIKNAKELTRRLYSGFSALNRKPKS